MRKYSEMFNAIRIALRTGAEQIQSIDPLAIPNIVRAAQRQGFKIDQSFANFTCGWVRLYNVQNTTKGKIYELGAMGIQIEWRIDRNDNETASMKFWINTDANK